MSRSAAGEALRDVSVRVPVSRALVLRYPLAPEQPIEEGEKLVRFDPPAETLEGERIHQWIGARFELDRPSSDLERVARQQVFVRALLEQGFDFSQVVGVDLRAGRLRRPRGGSADVEILNAPRGCARRRSTASRC